MTYLVGVDLGQQSDWTALALVQTLAPADVPLGVAAPLSLRHLERLRQTSYVAVVEHVAGLLRTPALAAVGATLIIDSTGVGRAVLDQFRAAGLAPVAVTITGGDRVTRAGNEWHVPKRDLVAAVQVALQNGQLQIAQALPLAETLRAELANFRMTISLSGHDSYGAGTPWREGAHDDLVLATALATWYARRRGAVGYVMR